MAKAQWSDVFKPGGMGEQLLLWSILGQLIGGLLDPAISELTQDLRSASMVESLPPADLATAVNRGFRTMASAAGEAGRSGLNEGKFKTLVELAGEAPGPETLVEALRRGIIAENTATGDLPSFVDGIRQGNLRDIWAPMMQQLAIIIPSQAEALDALLKGQVSHDEAHRRYIEAGGDPTWFQTAFDANGQAPTPVQALELLNRGIIPASGTGPQSVSYEQAFLEGPWRNKWLPAFEALRWYLPPPRTVTAMLKEGALTTAEAATYLTQQGLKPDLVQKYLSAASHTASPAGKSLTQAQIVALYEDKLTTETEALASLRALKYSAADAKLILALADLKHASQALAGAVAQTKALYLGHKITKIEATANLQALKVDTTEITALLAIWDREISQAVRTLSMSEISGAFYYQIITYTEATGYLETLGYSAHDAWVILSLRAKGPLPNEPGKPPAPIGVTP